MSHYSNLEDDEADLSELFGVLWSHKLLIALVTGLSIFLTGYYAVTAKKKFTAKSLFQIEQSDSSSGFNLSGELGALASLAGFAGASGTSSTDVLLERAKGREFIVEMQKNFQLIEIFTSTHIIQILGSRRRSIKNYWWQTTELENAIIESNIPKLQKNVEFELTEGGAIKISVTHIDPKKASYYANNLMEEIRKLVEKEAKASKALRLNYLSETLADALQEMEKAQKNLKDYALKNSAMAQENFISDS